MPIDSRPCACPQRECRRARKPLGRVFLASSSFLRLLLSADVMSFLGSIVKAGLAEEGGKIAEKTTLNAVLSREGHRGRGHEHAGEVRSTRCSALEISSYAG